MQKYNKKDAKRQPNEKKYYLCRMKLSVSQYAALCKCSRQNILKKIKRNSLPAGVAAEKVGNTFIIIIEENKNK